jgi:hypothetical protein
LITLRKLMDIKKPDPYRSGFSGEGGIRTHDTFGIPAFQASALGQTMRPLPYCGQNYTTGWLIFINQTANIRQQKAIPGLP